MPPIKRFSKEKIIDTAFEIARTEGIENITIRKVAEKMGSSIAPIYVNFKSVDELIEEVVKKIFAVSRQLLRKQNSGDLFRDIGIASVRFAKLYPMLFRDLVMRNNSYMQSYESEMGILLKQMKKEPNLDGLTDVELKDILFRMRAFHTGVSVMVANGLLEEDFDEKKIMDVLDRTATDLIMVTRLRKKEQSKK